MKKNKMMRIASVLLVAVLLSTCAISGTFAKYISTASSSDKATVAKWDVKVEDAKLGVENTTFTFDIFGEKLAPGMSGSFELNISNASEVSAIYSIEYTVTNVGGVPIEFSTDGTTWKADIDDVVDKALAAGETVINIDWKWVTTSDAADTAFGVKGTLDTVKVDVAITVEQAD